MSVMGGNGGAGSTTVGGWLRNSVARSSFGRIKAVNGSPSTIWLGGQSSTSWLSTEVDPSAAFYTFRKHWQQLLETMDRTRQRKQARLLWSVVLSFIVRLYLP